MKSQNTKIHMRTARFSKTNLPAVGDRVQYRPLHKLIQKMSRIVSIRGDMAALESGGNFPLDRLTKI